MQSIRWYLLFGEVVEMKKNSIKKDIYNEPMENLENTIVNWGFKKFRAKQVNDWIYKGINSFDEMINISKDVRAKLQEEYDLNAIRIEKKFLSKDGTIKYLLRLQDNCLIEAVLMKYSHGNTICISTQVGCRMNCSFCASGIDGLERNLTRGEMVGQIIKISKAEDVKISNIVLMGAGEPLDNYKEVVKFIDGLNDKNGLFISQRNLTLSTCGMAHKIKELADKEYGITLAISFHNPFDRERTLTMPVNKSYPINELIEAIDYYISKTSRRVTIEYALIEGLNDSEDYAKRLGELFRGKLVHINLIPVNPVKTKDFKPTKNKEMAKFRKILLERYKIETTIRRELGSDINAACGQLKRSYVAEENK